MSDDRHQRVKEIFGAALAAAADERGALLDDACGDDAALRAEVESLLGHADAPAVDLDAAADQLKDRIGVRDEPERHPQHVGAYRIERTLGYGGMGVVYLAQQEHPQRTVALKVIRSGSSSASRRRFEREAEVLGRLQHPGIAQIFEAGAADSGQGVQPFIAMEYVDGTPVTTYVESRALPIRERLELMVMVCEAMHHAHEHGVVHRDLKPPNVLVDGRGQPKILDFGIARLTETEDVTQTLTTRTGQLIGTLQFMSPEQLSGDVECVDARSDVFALGVLVYRLLSGRYPHDVAGRTIPDAIRFLSQEEPTPLGHVDRLFRGDLDTIVGKALERDPARRYSTAADLGRDIERHLHDEPVVARPPTTTYQLVKFARRHKAFVTGLAAVFIVLIAGIIGIGVALVEANEQRDLAQRQFRVARAVNDFLNEELLSQADPYTGADHELTLRQAIYDAAESLETRFAGEPLVEAQIRVNLARTFGRLSDAETALTHGERALELRRAHGTEAEVAESIIVVATITSQAGDYPRSEALHREGLAMQRRLLAPDHPDLVASVNRMAVIHLAKGELVAAEALFREMLDIGRRTHDGDHPDVASSVYWLGYTLRSSGRLDDAEPLCREALEMRRRLNGDAHPLVAGALLNLAAIHRERGEFEPARRLSRDAVEMYREVLGTPHGRVATAINQYGLVLMEEGRLDDARTVLREAYDDRVAIGRGGHVDLAISMASLGELERRCDAFADAERWVSDGLEIMRPQTAPDDPYLADALLTLGRVYVAQGRAVDAEPLLREALAIRERLFVVASNRVVDTRLALAECRLAQDERADARALVERSLAELNEVSHYTTPRRVWAAALLSALEG